MGFTDGTTNTIPYGWHLQYQFLWSVHVLMHPTIDFDLRAYRQTYCKKHKLDEQDAARIAK